MLELTPNMTVKTLLSISFLIEGAMPMPYIKLSLSRRRYVLQVCLLFHEIVNLCANLPNVALFFSFIGSRSIQKLRHMIIKGLGNNNTMYEYKSVDKPHLLLTWRWILNRPLAIRSWKGVRSCHPGPLEQYLSLGQPAKSPTNFWLHYDMFS